MTYHYTIPIVPRTKKNSQQIFKNRRTGRSFIAPSKVYQEYEEEAGYFLRPKPDSPIDYPVHVKCLFYMPTYRAVDRTNLEEAAHDALVKWGILLDDNRDIIASGDGTRVLYDKHNPRTEIIITPYEEEYEIWKKSKAR